MRLFLDANVLFSAAHNPSGNAHALFVLARKGRVKLYSSGFAPQRSSLTEAWSIHFPAMSGGRHGRPQARSTGELDESGIEGRQTSA